MRIGERERGSGKEEWEQTLDGRGREREKPTTARAHNP